MTRTVIALYDDFADASATVRDMVDNGFQRDDISLMASDMEGEYSSHLDRDRAEIDTYEEADGAAEGAGVGAGIGAAIGGLGGLLIGLGALTIPGIGPVIAAGPLAAALTGLAGAGAGAVAGGVTGGLLGALVDMGVPEETASYYAEGLRRGSHLVSARIPDHLSDRAVDIMNKHNPVDINERVATWRESGWSGYDTAAGPYETRETGRYTDTGVDTVDYSSTPYTDYQDRFRTHFSNSMHSGNYTYEQYEPAYRYGYDLATDERYYERDWTDVEPEARRHWEERNPGTWEEFKSAVRHAWAEIKDSVS